TSGYALGDHLRAIRQHTSRRVIDWVIANRQPISPDVARRYRAQGAEPVSVNLGDLQKLGYRVVLDNLLEEHGVIRHDPARLSQLLFEEFLSSRHPPKPCPIEILVRFRNQKSQDRSRPLLKIGLSR